MGKAGTLAEIVLLLESRISVGISVWAQLPIGKVRSSSHYWSIKWLSSKLRAMSGKDCGACKKTDILEGKGVAGNPRKHLRLSKISGNPQQTHVYQHWKNISF